MALVRDPAPPTATLSGETYNVEGFDEQLFDMALFGMFVPTSGPPPLATVSQEYVARQAFDPAIFDPTIFGHETRVYGAPLATLTPDPAPPAA